MFNPLAISNLLYVIENLTLKEQDESIITVAEITFFFRKTAKYVLFDRRTNKGSLK
jgi:hypothetical protein